MRASPLFFLSFAAAILAACNVYTPDLLGPVGGATTSSPSISGGGGGQGGSATTDGTGSSQVGTGGTGGSSTTSSTSSTSSGGIPTTCAEANQSYGCCGTDGVVYYCSMGVLKSKTCTGTYVCGWSTMYSDYSCVPPPSGTDPSGTHPIACQ